MAEADAGDDPETEEKKAKRLTPAQWAEATELWELGQITMSDLVARFGITHTAISSYFKRHKITRGSRKAEVAEAVGSRVKAEAVEAVTNFAMLKRARIEETKQQAYQATTVVHTMVMKALVEAHKGSKPLAAAEMKHLRAASAILAQVRQERYKILEIENEIDDNSLPDLIVRDLSDEEITDLQNRDEDDFDLELPELEDLADDDVVLEGEE
ncbi:hypothetical protein SAMN05216548_11417 [Faunimonas pinastri]|uniref:DNA-binding protein n=1 Tax=Faunimonas pinastri TaxID=1855383 RepID=A0A1H9MRZ5_9HYPH|nr:hypothetical protein [Faunimonas pinastri]SER26257.1 hypothetical protein SAMN05216548_11417 [Faunimonas pinastri]